MIACGHCGKGFEERHPKARFCSARCRGLAWRAERTRSLVGALDEAERAIQRARRVLGTERRGN